MGFQRQLLCRGYGIESGQVVTNGNVLIGATDRGECAPVV
jgi:hypothetical protein